MLRLQVYATISGLRPSFQKRYKNHKHNISKDVGNKSHSREDLVVVKDMLFNNGEKMILDRI